MRALYIIGLAGLGLTVGSAVACSQASSERSDDTAGALSATGAATGTMGQTFVTLSTPNCGFPCPAHYVQDVKTGALTPIGKIDYGSLSDADIARIKAAPDGGVVLHGAIVSSGSLLPSFNVTEAYLGQPGATFGKGDVFYQGGDSNPLDPSAAGPCSEGSVSPLNVVGATSSCYGAIDVSLVDSSPARQVFLKAQVSWADAIVAGKLVANDAGAGAQTLRAAQVFRKMGTPPARRLTVDKNLLRDPTGNAITLRGWNWGQWGTYQTNDEIANQAAQNANVVRIPLRWWGFYGGSLTSGIDSRDMNSPGYILPSHLAYLDMMVTRATAQGLWVDLFVDSNCGQGTYDYDANWVATCGTVTTPGQKGNPPLQNFINTPAMAQAFMTVWTFLAQRYQAFDYIGMYELLPEPHFGCSKEHVCETPTATTPFYGPLIDAVRNVDDVTPLLIGPTGGYDVTLIGDSYIASTPNGKVNPPPGIIYTGDFLDDAATYPDYVTRFVLPFSTTNHVPVFIQQVGVSDADHVDDAGAQDGSSTARRHPRRARRTRASAGRGWTYREQHSNGVGYAPYWQEADGGVGGGTRRG